MKCGATTTTARSVGRTTCAGPNGSARWTLRPRALRVATIWSPLPRARRRFSTALRTMHASPRLQVALSMARWTKTLDPPATRARPAKATLFVPRTFYAPTQFVGGHMLWGCHLPPHHQWSVSVQATQTQPPMSHAPHRRLPSQALGPAPLRTIAARHRRHRPHQQQTGVEVHVQ
jgi:hypothetical protein